MNVSPMHTAAGTIDGFISSRLMAAYRLDGDHVIHVALDHYADDRTFWSYVLEHNGVTIFEGKDMSTPDGATYPEVARTTLTFLTLRPGDVEAEYFESYTPEQIEWRDSYAEELSLFAMERFEGNDA